MLWNSIILLNPENFHFTFLLNFFSLIIYAHPYGSVSVGPSSYISPEGIKYYVWYFHLCPRIIFLLVWAFCMTSIYFLSFFPPLFFWLSEKSYSACALVFLACSLLITLLNIAMTAFKLKVFNLKIAANFSLTKS